MQFDDRIPLIATHALYQIEFDKHMLHSRKGGIDIK